MESVTSYPQVPEEQNEPVVHYDFNQIEDNVKIIVIRKQKKVIL